jgi:stage V sporulation protein S
MNAQSLPVARAVGEPSTDANEDHDTTNDMLKVSTRSRPSAVAGAIAGVIREHGSAEVQSIGAGATNQAIKAVAIARSYLREDGIDITCVPSFIDIAIESQERTAIRLLIERR